MEQSSEMSTLENDFVRKISTLSSNESSVDNTLADSKAENRDEDDPVVDDIRQFKSDVPSTQSTLMSGATRSRHETITMTEKLTCPCCQQSFANRASTMNEPRCIIRQKHSLMSLSDEENGDVDNIHEDMLPGTLSEGVQYHPTGVLVQGWLHKKGTGKDWLGNTSWKARWARVITAKVDGYSCEVPLMQIYWHSSAPIPSTVILLESTVVLAIDLSDKDQWDSFRFEIRHAATKENPTISVTRTFTAPKISRDTWVYMISEALLCFEKEMAYHKKFALLRSHVERPKISVFKEVQTGECSSSADVQSSNNTPPCIPPRPSRNDPLGLPRIPRPTKTVVPKKTATVTH